MSVTGTDLFAGAGGTTTGAVQVPGVSVRIAANHNQVVTDIHALNHQDTDHAVVDLHLERPSFFPKTDWLWASPECKKWSQANSMPLPAIEEGLFEDPLSDEAKVRSRLLMFDVLRFVEYHRYRLVFVENVVDIATQAKYATAWQVWRQELRALGYRWRVISLNSMHAQLLGLPAPQSRDRIYIVAWPEGEKAPDLERIVRPQAYCPRCDVFAEAVQSWKPKREVGRYRQSYTYNCRTCNRPVEPGFLPALTAIDWSILGQRIGDRLTDKTRLRVAHGIARYWGPLSLEAAGNTYDAADPRHPRHDELDGYYRIWPAEEPLRALHSTGSKALAVPVEGREGKQARPVEEPLRTQTGRAETAFIAELFGTSTARPVEDPLAAVTAGGNHHALVTRHYGPKGGDPGRHTTPVEEVLRTLTGNGGNMSLLQPYYGTAEAGRPVTEPMGALTTHDRYALLQAFILDRRGEYRTRSMGDPLSTITANDTTKALIHRMNDSGPGMSTPVGEYLRTLTTGGNVALLEQPERRPVTPKDLAAAMEMVPEVLFRMLQPHEVAAGMAFPADYKWQPPDRAKPISNRDLVAAAGQAVTPPASRDVIGVAVEVFGIDTERAA